VKKKILNSQDIMLIKGLYAMYPANDDETASDEDMAIKRSN
jgi:hypothetical protein